MKSIDNLFELLPNKWNFLLETYSKKSQEELSQFILSESKSKEIYPKLADIFKAYELTDIQNIKAVILGQDPYHGENQAHGLSFSVQSNVKLPPSLKNIFKELNEDLQITPVESGELTQWAREGVFLLNTVLTVEKAKAGSHRKKGWEQFTELTIKEINNRVDHCAFILWGSPAQKFKKLIDTEKHLIIESVHPSPLSSYRGFFGSRPFSKVNKFLKTLGKTEIDWKLN